VFGKGLIAVPDATLVGVFKNSIPAVRPPPGEGQIVSWAGQVVRGWGQQRCLNSASLLHHTVPYGCHTARHGLRGQYGSGAGRAGHARDGGGPQVACQGLQDLLQDRAQKRPPGSPLVRRRPQGRLGAPERSQAPKVATLLGREGLPAGGVGRQQPPSQLGPPPGFRRRRRWGLTNSATRRKSSTSKRKVFSPSPSCRRPTPERGASCLAARPPPRPAGRPRRGRP
jgi:hypothetical protein